jgi:uncharacterized protein (DUF433 family)
MANNVIVADPETLDGKGGVRGTRLSVEFLLELAASWARARKVIHSPLGK